MQMLCTARALRDAGLNVKIVSLAHGTLESAVHMSGLPLSFIELGSPLKRLMAIVRCCCAFKPHFIQSTHAFANLYAALAARAIGSVGIGALRSDYGHCVQSNGAWASWLMRVPDAVFVNSRRAYEDVLRAGLVSQSRLYLIRNGIAAPDHTASPRSLREGITAVVVCRLVAVKRIDRFLRGLALARKTVPQLRGLIVGDGPDRGTLTELAMGLGLYPDFVDFVGAVNDPSHHISQCHVLVLTSEHESTPNAILEAMSLGLPVISTPAGDVEEIVADRLRGFVVPFEDDAILADRLVMLAVNADLRREMGIRARSWVREEYSIHRLRRSLLEAYSDLAPVALKARLLQLCRCE
jgi:glycosyltransferase involved in cell wall biosynthesis